MPDGRYSHTSCLLRAWLYPAICFHNLHTSKSGCRPCINKGDCSIALLHFADGCSKTGSPISSTPLTALTPTPSPRDATMLLKLSNVLPLAFVISPTSGSIIKVGVITKRKTNDSQTDKVSLTRKHTGGESLVRERVYNRTAEIGRRPD